MSHFLCDSAECANKKNMAFKTMAELEIHRHRDHTGS